MNPYRQRSVPEGLCPNCLHSWSAHDPSQSELDAWCRQNGYPLVVRRKPPRCHVSVVVSGIGASCHCKRM